MEGTVLSIGALDLGLFLLVYCVGHIGYLAFYSTWMVIFGVASVALCDLSARIFKARDRTQLRSIGYQLLGPAPVILALALMPWTGSPMVHSVILAVLIPDLVAIGSHTMDHVEADLGIERTRLHPRRGQVINTLKSFVYVAPVVFHYLTTVAGWTRTSARLQPGHTRRSQTQKSRSRSMRRRLLGCRRITISCWRRATFSGREISPTPHRRR